MRKISLLICLAACHPDDEGEGLPLSPCNDLMQCAVGMECWWEYDTRILDTEVYVDAAVCVEIGETPIACDVDAECPGELLCLTGGCYYVTHWD